MHQKTNLSNHPVAAGCVGPLDEAVDLLRSFAWYAVGSTGCMIAGCGEDIPRCSDAKDEGDIKIQ